MDKRRYYIWLLIPLICSVCFGTLGDITLDNAGNKIVWPNNSKTFSIAASGSMSESVDYLWPPADAVSGGQALLSDSTGVLSWGTPTTAAAHALMSGTHSDTTNSTPPARGSIIYGNSTPLWDELVLGASGTIFRSDGTDAGWAATTLITQLGTIVTGTWQATDVDVPYGGTGVSALTDGGLLLGSGSSAITALGVAANGQIPIGDGATDPVLATLTEGLAIDVTNGAGSISIAVDTTELDDVTWSDGSNASNVHTYDVSGQDHTMTAGDGLMTFSHDVNVLGRFIPNDNGVSTHLLAAYWPFDSNDVAYDYSGNGHDGTITGTPVTVDGRFGAALDFDATNPDNILVPDNGLEPASITVSVWVKTTQDDQDIYRQWEGAPNRCLALNIDSSDRAVFSITNNGTNIFSAVDLTGTSVSDGEWHLLTGTYESPNVRLYIDSVLVRTNSGASGDLCAVNADVKIADNFVRTNNFDGLMDEMMVFGRALSAEEIKSLYESNRQLKDERLFPVYDDLPPSPIIAAKLGSTAPTLATFVSDIQQYTFDATNDFVIGSTEVTHGWKEGTIITPHIHWATNGLEGTAQGVQWQLKLTVGDSSEAFSAQATTVVDATIPASTPDRTHFMTDFDTTIDGADLKINAYICWRLERIATAHGNGEPAADPFGLAVGFHVEMDTAGSFTATAK